MLSSGKTTVKSFHQSWWPVLAVALDFAVAAAMQPNAVTDALFAKMKKYWTEPQIVEIAAVVAINGFLNRWNDTMLPPLEAEPTAFAGQHLAHHFK